MIRSICKNKNNYVYFRFSKVFGAGEIPSRRLQPAKRFDDKIKSARTGGIPAPAVKARMGEDFSYHQYPLCPEVFRGV